jgi:hypothetical protein
LKTAMPVKFGAIEDIVIQGDPKSMIPKYVLISQERKHHMS